MSVPKPPLSMYAHLTFTSVHHVPVKGKNRREQLDVITKNKVYAYIMACYKDVTFYVPAVPQAGFIMYPVYTTSFQVISN